MGKRENEESEINFTINGEIFTVNPETEKFDLNTNLVDFIRDTAHLKGTKFMCREGGCGACVVTATTIDPATGAKVTKAVNSCLTPVLSCNGWDISTVERLGNKDVGYHKIQERLTQFNGTQCGYCSPGMVMNMYSLLNSKDKVKVQDINESFDGNICRCTGYRPILDAFKSLAVDAPVDLLNRCNDIEDCGKCPKARTEHCCEQKSSGAQPIPTPPDINIKLPTGEEWIQPLTLETALSSIVRFVSTGKKYRVVAGNTGTGVFKYDGPYNAYLDINKIAECKKTKIHAAEVVLGAGTTLTVAIQLLQEASKLPGYEYTAGISKHLGRVANVPVRNNGTVGGNLMMKHAHHDFPSDVFLLLESVGATLSIVEGKSAQGLKCLRTLCCPKSYTILDFLNMDMKGKLIVSIHFATWKGNYHFRSFKITRRYQNAHAYVNAAFLIKVDPDKNFKVTEKPRIVFGGVNPKFIHAMEVEAFMNGKCLVDQQTVKGIMDIMDREIQPDYHPPDAKPEYRKNLAKNLVYKTILGIVGEKGSVQLQSGGPDIQREISHGKQSYDRYEENGVLYKAVNKIESAVQASGEAEYINDIPPRPDELFGAFVLSTVACADLIAVDPSDALKIPGVVAYISAKDVPAQNNYMTYNFFPVLSSEPIFATEKINHAGQPIGMIVAKSQAVASRAVKKVSVTYANQKKPVLTIADSLKKVEAEGNLASNFILTAKSRNERSVDKSKHSVTGTIQIGAQYHFHMETQCCICVPKEDGMDVFSATQWTDHGQIVIAEVLGIPTNNVNIEVRRLGGSFGGKITKATYLAAATAVAAKRLNKPVRVNLDLETNMQMMGKRNPYLSRYTVGFDDNGKIESLNVEIFCDPGCTTTEADSFLAANHVQNVYAADGWEIKPGFLLTDTPSNTSCRAPGTTQGVATIEYIMEHIAHTLRKNPAEIRVANFLNQGDYIVTSGKEFNTENLIRRMWAELKVSGDYENRKMEIQVFNKLNRWKKRGLSFVPVRYELDYFNMVKFPATVAINHRDGYVTVGHGGIEMGQGLNTKVAQIVADTLEIPLNKIKIRPTNTFLGINAMATGGSFGSEICCAAAQQACKILIDRMQPIKETLEDKSWENVVTQSFNAHIDLFASYMYGPNDKYKDYYVWVANLTEVEIDVLTGEYKVSRVDIIEDAGKSLNPAVDIGQIEGAYIMGQGLWTTEKLVYDENTGALLTNNTWEYKPPESKDIPEDFRVTLLSNAQNPDGIMRSKATGEPPLVSSVAVVFAIKQAIDSAREDAGNKEWYQLDGPVTPEDILHYALTSSNQFTI